MKTSVAVLLTLWVAGVISGAAGVTLDSALARTLEKNPRILQAKTALEAAAGQRLILRSTALPKGLIGGIAGVQGGRRAQTSTQPFAFAYGSFLQPLFHAGIPASFRRGDIALLIAQQELNVTVVDELHRARLAFYGALYQRSLESLGRSQRARLEQNIAGEKARYEAGQSERGAFTSAILLARELDPKIESARTASGVAILQLVQSMGGDLGAGATLPTPEGNLAFEAIDLQAEREIDPALERRVDLKLARLLIRAAREDQRIIAAGYYPALNAVASGEAIPVSGIHRDSGGSPQSTDDTVASEVRGGVSYTWRVIDNGKVGGEVAQQRAARETNELQLQKLEANLPRELTRLQNNLRAIAARHWSLLQAAEVAEQNVASVEENRAQGFASILDFRNAESSLLVTRRGILSAVYEQKVALAEWDRATGRYFQFSGDTGGKVH
ncbi:MAG: TolC family protein [Chthoniobacterales bacterium]|nr:TolC family protein [Chthoniobacterales bacterium]